MAQAVRADVRYLNDEWKTRDEMPRIYSKETRYANTSPRELEILDARPLSESGELDLDRNGFVLVRHESSVRDFSDPDRVAETYISEMESLIRELTGADQAVGHRQSIDKSGAA